MKRVAAVLVGSLCLVASAEPPEASGPRAPPAKASPKPPARAPAKVSPKPAGSSYQLTPEALDRYLRYRAESDAAVLESANALVQPGAGDPAAPREIRISFKEMYEADLKLREKHGLATEDFQQIDRMVRDVCEARFSSESATSREMLRIHERNAAEGTDEQLRAMSRAIAAMLRKQMEEQPGLDEQRSRYGDANVELLLRREKELKEIWTRKDAGAARMLEALSPPPANTIKL
jgi:hypothetical protein